MPASNEVAKKLAEFTIRPQLDSLQQGLTLEAQPQIVHQRRKELTRWLCSGVLLCRDKLSVRLTLDCGDDSVLRAKVRAYYARVQNAPPAASGKETTKGEEVYAGKTGRFEIEPQTEDNFNTWFQGELVHCQAALAQQASG
ncbi:MAG TPA: hypothetical protein VFW87_25430 [Pirellulales bacterium]|nr:hypothetical protein [Pirellulales bacterium]